MEEISNAAAQDTSNLDVRNIENQSGLVDAEITSSAPTSKGNDGLDYWYGKKYFKNAIAQVVFLSLSGKDSIWSADDRLRKLIQCFPYREAIDSLQSVHAKTSSQVNSADDRDPFKTLVCLAGLIIRQGTDPDRAILLKVIQRLAKRSFTFGFNPSSGLGIETEPTARMNPSSQVEPGGSEVEKSDAFYTASLKERADLSGSRLEYHYERHDMDTFKVELTFRGHKFVGLGKSKQLAKHQASKNACIYLNEQR